MARILIYVLIAISPVCAWADGVFVEALKNGEAMSPISPDLVTRIQDVVADAEDLVIKAKRTIRFQHQPNCGRVAFALMRPKTGEIFSDTGGEINICTDGLPPRLECRNLGFVLAGQRCPDGSKPMVSQEVQDAIDAAVQAGGLDWETVSKKQ